MKPVAIGVIGCGEIAQIKHLPNIQKLHDRFTLRAICDIDTKKLVTVSTLYPNVSVHTTVASLLNEPIDAVLILTNGGHLDELIPAAEAGKHIFVEKPLCYSPNEAEQVINAVKRAGVIAMVGYMKRFDPGVHYGYQLLQTMGGLRFVQAELWHPTQDRYTGPYFPQRETFQTKPPYSSLVHYVTAGRAAKPLMDCLGSSSTTEQRIAYFFLVSTGIHQINLLRALLGEPRIVCAHLWNQALAGSAQLIFPHDVYAVFNWLFLPEGEHHEQIHFIADSKRLTLQFPSAYLNTSPVQAIWRGEGDQNELFEHRAVTSYSEPFLLELEHFHACITHAEMPRTSLEDALADLSLIREIVGVMEQH